MKIWEKTLICAALLGISEVCAAAPDDPALKLLGITPQAMPQQPAAPASDNAVANFTRPAPNQQSLKAAEAAGAAPDDTPKALRELALPAQGQVPAQSGDLTLPDADPQAQAQAQQEAQSEESVPFATDLTFAKLGAKTGVVLRAGMEGTGLDFTLPLDKVITSARLALNIEVPEDMAKRGSHLEMTLNGQPVGTLPLNSTSGPMHFELILPFEYFGTANTFNFRVADDEEFSCMIDYTRRFVISILPDSTLHLEGHRLEVGSDLNIFPLPFFDPFDVTKSAVSVVLPHEPKPDSLTAAAILASWFGIRSDYRGVKFKTLFGSIPRDNAIVIGHPGEQIGSVTMPASDSVRMVDNPVSPGTKLVLIAGRDLQAMRNAVYRLTSGHIEPGSVSFEVTEQKITGRNAYDAPKWIPTNRRVYLSELLRPDQSLVSAGTWHSPLNISFRAAPDLYQLYGEPVKLALDYNFPLEKWIDEDHSWLNVTLSGNFLQNLPVNKIGLIETLWRYFGGDARQEHYDLPVQPYMIYGDNNLSLYFDIKLKKGAPCSVLHDNNIKSAILDSSYIDLSSTDHFAKLPNLSFFVGASFPFTKYADYSQTLLLLPEAPSASEVQALLDLCARAGKSTGVPVWFATTVLGTKAVEESPALMNKDIIAVGSLKQSEFIKDLTKGSAFIYSDSAHDLTIREYGSLSFEGGFLRTLERLLSGDFRTQNTEATRYLRSNMQWRGFLSMLSPYKSGRIVVLATSSDDGELRKLTDDLDNDLVNRDVGGDVTVISGTDTVRSFTVGDSEYTGSVSGYFKTLHLLGQHAVWLAIAAMIVIIALGIMISACLKRRAQKRLALTGQTRDNQ